MVTITELKQAVFSMLKNKATGLNSFPIEFFQIYWDVISEDLYRAVTTFYRNSLDLWRINQAYISLILKANPPTSISNYNPINILSVIPKIIIKILTTILQPFIP
jgi:hypothetical protein